jgi:hypothetical protein
VRIDAAGRLPVDGTGFSSSISAQTWCAGHLRADEPALVRAGAEFEDGKLIERHNESGVTLTPRDRPIHRS